MLSLSTSSSKAPSTNSPTSTDAIPSSKINPNNSSSNSIKTDSLKSPPTATSYNPHPSTTTWSSASILWNFKSNLKGRINFVCIHLNRGRWWRAGGIFWGKNWIKEVSTTSSRPLAKSGRGTSRLFTSSEKNKINSNTQSRPSLKKSPIAKKMENNVWSKKLKSWDNSSTQISWSWRRFSRLKILSTLCSNFFQGASSTTK